VAFCFSYSWIIRVSELAGGVVVSSVEEMAREIWRLAGKGSARHELAEAGRNAWEQKYTWDKVVDAYEVLYNEACVFRRTH
jgi:glycosyltransferase involved in cell wall biosynthesis